MSIQSANFLLAGPLSASGSSNATVQITPGVEFIHFKLSAGYLAVAGTSGVRFNFQVSPDNSTFTNVAQLAGGNITVANAANTRLDSDVTIYANGWRIKSTTPINYIKVTATNLDATNSASISVTALIHTSYD